jgi:hypothetical protein
MKENAEAFWIIKLRKKINYNLILTLISAKLYKIKSEGLPTLLIINS